jgi:hypothetical protein
MGSAGRRTLILVLVALALVSVAALIFRLDQSPHAPATDSVSSRVLPSSVPTVDPEVVSGPLPDVGDNPKAVAAAIRLAFGPHLSSVSVESTRMVGQNLSDGTQVYFFHVKYGLVGQTTMADTFVSTLNDGGFVPPITNLGSDGDRMGPTRFAELLLAYSYVTVEPFGALESWETAWGRHESDEPTATMRIFGKDRPIKDIWVVTPGTATQHDFRRLQGGKGSTPGYVFSFPLGGHPEFIYKDAELGEWVYFPN